MATLVIQPDATAGKDTFYGTIHNTRGEPTLDRMAIGGFADWYYSYIQFDIPPIPAESITSVTLSLYRFYYEAWDTGENSAKIQRITENWTESGVTRSNNPAAVDYSGYGFVSINNQGWKVFDVTALIKDYINGVYPNYGFKITALTNSLANGVHFRTSDYTADATLRPKLTFETSTFTPHIMWFT
jgi:hypothetical protein